MQKSFAPFPPPCYTIAVKRHTIQHRLFIAYTLPLLLPLLLFGTLSIRTSKQVIEEELSVSTEKTLGLIAQKIEGILLQMVVISNDFSMDSDVTKALINNAGTEKGSQQLRERDFLAEMIERVTYRVDKNRYYLRLVSFEDEEFHSTSLEPLPLPDPVEQEWYARMLERPWRIAWILDRQEHLISITEGNIDGESPMIVGANVIQHVLSGEPLGIIAVGTSAERVGDSLMPSLKKGEQLYIVDSLGDILFSLSEDGRNSWDEVNAGSDEFLVFRKPVPTSNWEAVLLTPRLVLQESVSYWMLVMLMLLGASLLLSFPVSFFVARKFTAPIRVLAEDMQKVSSGELTTRTTPVGNDEIGDLSLAFNAMLDRINELMSRLGEEQQQKMEFEMEALFWQINPHFIYNTLAGIRFMLENRPVEEVDEALIALVRILKHTLARSGEYVTVSEEISILKEYCRIQQIRTAGQARFEIYVDPSIMTCSILKLTLQPLVENAVFHGLGPKGGKGLVTVNGFRLGDDIIFEIGDDGVGTDETTEGKSDSSRLFGGGIGIENVGERIALHFGKEYGVQLRPNEVKGTVAVVRLPFVVRERREENQ